MVPGVLGDEPSLNSLSDERTGERNVGVGDDENCASAGDRSAAGDATLNLRLYGIFCESSAVLPPVSRIDCADLGVSLLDCSHLCACGDCFPANLPLLRLNLSRSNPTNSLRDDERSSRASACAALCCDCFSDMAKQRARHNYTCLSLIHI